MGGQVKKEDFRKKISEIVKIIDVQIRNILFSVSLDLELGNTWKNTKMVEFQLIFPDHFTVAMLQVEAVNQKARKIFHVPIDSLLQMLELNFLFLKSSF